MCILALNLTRSNDIQVGSLSIRTFICIARPYLYWDYYIGLYLGVYYSRPKLVFHQYLYVADISRSDLY